MVDKSISIAGGETVSTFLTATTFYLLKERAVCDKLRDEIRDRFTTYNEIDASSCQQLPYLQAGINEGLRIYPPGSQGFPRVSPGLLVENNWVPKGVSFHAAKPPRFRIFDFSLSNRQKFTPVPGP